MLGTETNSIGCSKLIDMKGCKEPKNSKHGRQYDLDNSKVPKIIY